MAEYLAGATVIALKKPMEMAEYLAGATVIALKKPMESDIRPIAVGEVLRRLTSK